MGSGSFILKGTGSPLNQTVASLATVSGAGYGTGSVITINPNGSALTTLTITSPTISTAVGSAVNFNYSNGTTNGSTLGSAYVIWSPTLTNGGLIGGGAAYTVTDVGGSGFATRNSSGTGPDIVRLTDPGSAGLPVSGGVSTNNYFINQNYSTVSTSTPGSLVEQLSGGVSANTVTVDTTGLTSGAQLVLGTNVLTISNGGGFVFGGANPYAITASGAGGITSGTSGGNTIFNNFAASPGLDAEHRRLGPVGCCCNLRRDYYGQRHLQLQQHGDANPFGNDHRNGRCDGKRPGHAHHHS
jgi:hypothetical protein